MKPTMVAIADERTSAATLARLQAAYCAGVLKQGQLASAAIAHDEDCPAVGDGGCTCIPGLIIETPDGCRWVERGRGWEGEAS